MIGWQPRSVAISSSLDWPANGALTLQQAQPRARVPLAPSGIALGEFDEMERDASRRADDIGILDTLKALLFSAEPSQPAS